MCLWKRERIRLTNENMEESDRRMYEPKTIMTKKIVQKLTRSRKTRIKRVLGEKGDN